MTHNDEGPIHECCWTDFNQQTPSSSSSSSNVGGDEGGVGSEEDDAVSDKMDWWERRHPPSTFHGMWDLAPATDWTNAYPIGNGVRQFTSNDRLHLHMHLHMHRPASTRLARDVHVLLSSVILEFLRALHESDLYIYRIPYPNTHRTRISLQALGGLVSGEPWQQRISLSEETLFNSAANIRARRLAEQKIEYAAREKRIRGSGATKDDLVWEFARKYKGETQYEDFMNVRKALLKGDMAGAQAGARWLEQGQCDN